MSRFTGWEAVASRLVELVDSEDRRGEAQARLDVGQRASVREIAKRIATGHRGVLLADEVGMGKTRIAAALIEAVRQCGGRSIVVLPAGLGVQWQTELRIFNPDDRTLLPLRSYESFIRGFGQDGDDKFANRWQRSRDERLRNRRQQRELPQAAWRDEDVILISHSFASMRFPESTASETSARRELLRMFKALRAGRKRKLLSSDRGDRVCAHRAALAAFETEGDEALPIDLPHNLGQISSDAYRDLALPVIGRALGQFDLVVIDEAHKARGSDSSLSRILGPLVWESPTSFRLGMTATPVELEPEQWLDTLKRIMGVGTAAAGSDQSVQWEQVSAAIGTYANVCNRLQTEPLDDTLVSEFETATNSFAEALSPHVIHRDKRSDRELSAFRARHDCDYRDVRTVSVDPAALGRHWLRTICAAEALSLLADTGSAAKRFRLLLEKGHALDKLILEGDLDAADSNVDFWSRNLKLPDTQGIYEHPAILAAVKTIEEAASSGRKVLVFGTYVRPLRALTALLNARAMLRHLSEGRYWPASTIQHGTEHAVRAALAAPDCPPRLPSEPDRIAEMVIDQYRAFHRRRDQALRVLHRAVASKADEGDATARLLLRFWPMPASETEQGEGSITTLLQAIESHTDDPVEADGAGPRLLTVDQLISATKSVLTTLKAAAFDNSEDDEADKISSDDVDYQLLQEHRDQFSGREGAFARFMFGETAPQTRRMLQAAFNRDAAWPMVLVAQSMVGREGLNLHDACRTVVLLHAEWNPAVVEQQIGRVDRKNSRFLKEYRSGEWQRSGAPPPRIEVHCIQVQGGYDSYHWDVLRQRWASMRAQLHGDVVNVRDRARAVTDAALAALIKRVDAAAPNFSPE